MTRLWNFQINPFLNATRDSNLNAMKISTFHDSALFALQTDRFFGPLYTAYHPIHTALKTAYDAWVAQEHTQGGQTLNLEQLFALLSNTRIDGWDITIQTVYNKKTPPYKALLPHHRVPFQSGSQVERIEAVRSLSTNLTGIAALASVKTAVDAFYTQLDAANTAQKASKTTTTTQSSAMETSRIAMCNAQYANLGTLITHFATTPEVISNYFDVQTIRHGSQVHFTGHVKPQSVHTILKHTFATTDTLKLENKGTTSLQFYLAQTKNATAPTTGITLRPAEQQTQPATHLGDILTATYLIVYNPQTLVKGEFVVELL